jgi:hypothetical protein
MGGNTTITTKGGVDISAERIPLKEIGRDNFVKKFQKLLLKLNKEFKKEYKFPIWEDEKEIMNGGIFNGSTSFIMNPNYGSDEIVKYKPSAGDLDVAVPREIAKEIYNFLEKHEGREFIPGIRYVGNNASDENRLGNTIICIANATFGDISVQAQMDLELSEMKSGKQTDWSKFAHSSSFEDAKAGMKGVASKYFWRGLVGALHQLDSGFVVATPSSTPDKITLKKKQPSKIRLLNFGVDAGVGAGYEIMMDGKNPIKIDGNVVYREKKRAEKTYDKNLTNLMKIVFNTDKLKPTDLHSFVKVLELTNKYTDKKVKQIALDRFLEILFGINGQAQFIEPDPEEDLKLKMGMYNKAVEVLKLKSSSKVDEYVKAYMKKVHSLSERFKRHLLNTQPEHAWANDINEDNYYPDESINGGDDDTKEVKKLPKKEKSEPRNPELAKMSKEDKANEKEKQKQKEAKETEAKIILKKLIDLSLELDAATTDEEKEAIRKEMDALDKDADKKNKEAKEYEKEKKAKEAEAEQAAADEEANDEKDSKDDGEKE